MIKDIYRLFKGTITMKKSKFKKGDLVKVVCMNHFDSHYMKLTRQPIEIMQQELTHEQFLGFLKGNMIKYQCRAGVKDGESYEKDMAKFQRYHEWYVMALTGQKIDPRK